MDLAGLGAAVEQMPAWALDDARRVAERGLDALARNRRVAVPSVLYRSTALPLRLLPHGLLFSVLRRRSPFPDRWQGAPDDVDAASRGPMPLSSAT